MTETIKILEENIGGKVLDIGLGNYLFFGSNSKDKGNKNKNEQVILHQTKLLHSKETSNKMKGKLNGTKYLQISYLIGDKYSQYIKNSYNSLANKQCL